MSEVKSSKGRRLLELAEPVQETSLTLKVGTAEAPIELDFSTPSRIFDTELTKLMLELPILFEKLQPASEVSGGPIGPLQGNVATITNDYSAANADFMILCNASANPFTVTLPPAGAAGLILVIVKVDSSGNAVAVVPWGTDTIEGSASLSLASQYDKETLICNGSGIWIRSGKGQV